MTDLPAESYHDLAKWVPRPGRMSRRAVEAAVDISRRRMGMDSLDMLQFHWWDYNNIELAEVGFDRILVCAQSNAQPTNCEDFALLGQFTTRLELDLAHSSSDSRLR